MCSGSRPSNSQAPRTASRTGICSSNSTIPMPAVAGQFVERSGHAAARGIAHPADARTCCAHQRFDERKHRARVGAQVRLKIEFSARQQNRDAVIADRSGEQNLIAGPHRARINRHAGRGRPMPVVVMYMRSALPCSTTLVSPPAILTPAARAAPAMARTSASRISVGKPASRT